MQKGGIGRAEFRASLSLTAPPAGLSIPVQALWWNAKGDWARPTHLSTPSILPKEWPYLYRKEAEADYRYTRAGGNSTGSALNDEWEALLEGLLNAKS